MRADSTTPSGLEPAGLGQRATVVVSFLGGFAVMNAELAAGRLLAPYYGTSTTTWAVLIGTILTSLAVGGLLGGRLSKRGAPERWIALAMLVAAALLALLPRLGPWLMAGSLTRFRAGELAPLAAALAAVALLLAGPVVLLGALSPLLFQAAGRGISGLRSRPGEARASVGDLGPLAGRLYAASTFGSLVGTFGAGLVLIPWLGTARTVDVGALALALTGAAMAVRWHRPIRHVAAGVAVVMVALGLVGFAPTPAPTSGRLLWSGESRYNHIEVVAIGGQRQLRVNDGFAVQSLTFADGRLPLHDVWGFYALAPAWGQRPSPRRVLLLGMGGGTAAQIYRRLYPRARVTGVELDAAIVRAGRRHLGVSLEGVEVVIGDARTFVAAEAVRAPHAYDVILLDAFQFPYVPFQLTTREFFGAIEACLAPGGVLMVNAGRHGDHRAVVHALARTLASIFAHVQAADPERNSSNTLLVATRHDPRLAVGTAVLGEGSVPLFEGRALASRFVSMRRAAWPPGTMVLTDDHAPVEWLTDRIIWQALWR
jgi:spermidine synthase